MTKRLSLWIYTDRLWRETPQRSPGAIVFRAVLMADLGEVSSGAAIDNR